MIKELNILTAASLLLSGCRGLLPKPSPTPEPENKSQPSLVLPDKTVEIDARAGDLTQVYAYSIFGKNIPVGKFITWFLDINCGNNKNVVLRGNPAAENLSSVETIPQRFEVGESSQPGTYECEAVYTIQGQTGKQTVDIFVSVK